MQHRTWIVIALAAAACGGSGLTPLSAKSKSSMETEDARACNAGDGAACWRAGQAVDYPVSRKEDAPPKVGSTPDAPSAARLYRKGCDLGHARSCQAFGNLAFGFDSGVFEDSEDKRLRGAYAAFRRGCDLGDADACSSAAWMIKDEDTYPPADPKLQAELEAREAELEKARPAPAPADPAAADPAASADSAPTGE